MVALGLGLPGKKGICAKPRFQEMEVGSIYLYIVFIFVFVEAGGVDPTFPYPAKELRMSFLEARSTLSIALESRAQDWSVEDLLQVERPLVSKELHFTLDGVVHGSESSDD